MNQNTNKHYSFDPNKPVVMVESPYSGDIDRNVRYLQLCMAECGVLHNELPYASHAIMTQHSRCKNHYVSDYNKKWNVLTRDYAIKVSQRMRHRCDRTVFYIDRGWSTGMKAAKLYCQTHGLPFEERQLNAKGLAVKVPYMTEEFCNSVIADDGNYEKMLE